MTRIEKVQKMLQEHNITALIVDNPVDLYYLTGQELSLGRLVIEESGATLFVDGRYFEGCCQTTSLQVLLTAGYKKESAFGKWWKFEGKKAGFDADFTTYADFESLLAYDSEFIPLKSPIKLIREIKEPREIDALRQAASLGSKGFDYVCTLLKAGVTERDIAVALELFWLREGGEGLAFNPHIAFGEGTSHPHYQVTQRPLKKGEAVLIDIGVTLDHYHSDMTRVIFLDEPSAKMREIYQIVFEAYSKALALCKPGVKIGEVDRAARGWIEEKGFKEYFSHGLGHGVGLEIHEAPRVHSLGLDANRPLIEGMVLTIEPGIYLPKIGGVRLEDTIVITETGYENLTKRPLSSEPPLL